MPYTKAISPVSNSYLTKGKEYEIVWIENESDIHGNIFFIKDDDGHDLVCLEKGHSITGGLSWQLK